MKNEEQDLLGMLMSMNSDELPREDVIKSPFPWPGSKVTALDKILPHLPKTDYYAELFGGSGVVLLARQTAKNEIFNDRSSGISNFYTCVKNNELCKKLIAWLDFSVNSREEFNICRDTWKDVNDPVERAARWFTMVTCSFQAYSRHFGRSKSHKNRFSMKLPKALESFWPVHYRLRGTIIENSDFRQLMTDFDHHHRVFYLDPPYVTSETNNLGMYQDTMKRSDHIDMLERIFKLQGFVALSGYDNDLYDNYPWTNKYSWEQKSSASAAIGTENNNRIGTERTKNETRTECLWIKDFS